jgi:hypothetical protein
MKTTTPQHGENKTHEFFTLLIALRGIGMPLNLPKPYQLKQNILFNTKPNSNNYTSGLDPILSSSKYPFT